MSDFVDTYIAARTMRALEDIQDKDIAGYREAEKAWKEAAKANQELNDLTERWNKLVRVADLDSENLLGQRNEALKIFEENQDVLPFTVESAQARLKEVGRRAEYELAQTKYGGMGR